MNKLTLAIISLLLCFKGYTQNKNYIERLPLYNDYSITLKYIDSLKSEGVTKFFIYQTSVKSKELDHNNSVDRLIEISYFIWNQHNKANIILITDSFIYKPLQMSDTIFKFKNLLKLWLTKDEDKLKFVPPVDSPYGKDIVIFTNGISKQFFEYGKNLDYVLDPKKESFRISFLKLIKKETVKFQNKWEKSQSYDRMVDFKPL